MAEDGIARAGRSVDRGGRPSRTGAAAESADPRGIGRAGARDFFACDIFDAAPKDDLASMEHPIFSLSTRPDLSVQRYTRGGVEVEVTPSVKGRATIHDKDVLIYCTSQLMAAINAGRAVARTLHLVAHDFLMATRRETSGDSYRRLRDAFERLAGTRIVTNIATGPKDDPVEVTRGFGLIEDWEIVRRTRGGRMVEIRVTLSDWLYRAILSKSVLTLDRGYFDLRRPLERRLYELARKHCGRQPEWRVSLAVLHQKAGSQSPLRVFRAMLRDICAKGTMPQYALEIEAGDVLRVTPRAGAFGALTEEGAEGAAFPPAPPAPLAPETLETARARNPGQDVHALEARWRAVWAATGRPRIRNADRAFLGWLEGRAPDGSS